MIKKGESEDTEFKEKFNKEAIETAAAFANTKGGIIFIGVADKARVKGVQIGKETMNDWANQISQSTEPRVIPEIEQGEIGDKSIISHPPNFSNNADGDFAYVCPWYLPSSSLIKTMGS